MYSLILLFVPFFTLLAHMTQQELQNRKRFALLQGVLSFLCMGTFMRMQTMGGVVITDEFRQLYFPILVFTGFAVHGFYCWVKYRKFEKEYQKQMENQKNSKKKKKK